VVSAHEETDAVSAELSSQLKSSESRLTHLESALSVTRQECEALVNQLREDKSSYQGQLDEKDAFVCSISISIVKIILVYIVRWGFYYITQYQFYKMNIIS